MGLSTNEEKLRHNNKAIMWKERLLLIVLLTAQFISLCTETFLYPFFPPEAKSKGLTDLHIGFVFSAFEVSRFLFSLVVGYLIERLNTRIWCLIGGLLTTVTCVAFGLLSYAPDEYYLYLCLLVRLVAGAGTAALVVPSTSVMMKATSFQPSTVAGVIEAMHGVAFMAGPALGAAVNEICGYQCVFWTIGTALAVINTVQIFVVPNIEKETRDNQRVGHLLQIPGILLIYLQIFLYKIIQSSLNTTISKHIIYVYRKPASTVALLFTVLASVYLAACPLVTKIVNKEYIYSGLIGVWCMTTSMYFLIGPSPLLEFIFRGKRYFALPWILLCLQNAIIPFLFIATYPAAINLAAIKGHQKDSIKIYGAVAGLFNSALGGGSIIGPTIGGALTQSIGFGWMTTISSALALFMLCILITYLVYMKLSGKPLKPEDIKSYTEDTEIQSGDNTESDGGKPESAMLLSNDSH